MASSGVKLKNFIWRTALRYLVNPKKIVKVNGNRMFLDSKDSLLLSIRKNYEPKHVNLMKKIVKEGDHVADVGAHIGYYTLLLAKLVGPNGKVYSFEPDPENFKVLKRNVLENGYRNVVLENKAVSDKDGKVKLHLSKINKGDTRIYDPRDNEREGKTTYEVETVGLNSYFKKTNAKIKFLKLDIQGAEPLAFKGMGSLLKNRGLKFTMEFSPELLDSAGFNPKSLLIGLKKEGFKFFDLDANKKINSQKLDNLIGHYEKINYFTTLYCSK